jgi:hypothetical protein
MRKHFFWLRYPDPQTLGVGAELANEPREDRIELAVEGAPLPETHLEEYLHARGLRKVRRKLRMIRLLDRVPVHFWYVPQSGDVIQCELVTPIGVGE